MILGIDTIQEIAITSVVAIPIINGLVKVFVIPVLKLPKDYIPASSVILGVGVGLALIGFSWVGALGGALIGMASTGAYEFMARSVATGVDDVKKL